MGALLAATYQRKAQKQEARTRGVNLEVKMFTTRLVHCLEIRLQDVLERCYEIVLGKTRTCIKENLLTRVFEKD